MGCYNYVHNILVGTSYLLENDLQYLLHFWACGGLLLYLPLLEKKKASYLSSGIGLQRKEMGGKEDVMSYHVKCFFFPGGGGRGLELRVIRCRRP